MFEPMPDACHPTSDAAQALLAAIVDSTADAIISFDVHGRIQSWNRAAEALFGYTAQEAIGRGAELLVKPLGFVPPGETERGAFDRALAGDRFQRDTLRVAKDGTVIEVALTATQIKAADGRVLGVSAIMRNIGARKRVEAELRHSQERLTLALTAANAGVWDWLPLARKVRWSPECFELMGCDPALGVPAFDVWLQQFVFAEDRELVAEVFRAAARGDLGARSVDGQRVEVEYRINHPTRGVRWLSAPTRIEVEDGRVVRVVGLNIDITDPRRRRPSCARAKPVWRASCTRPWTRSSRSTRSFASAASIPRPNACLGSRPTRCWGSSSMSSSRHACATST